MAFTHRKLIALLTLLALPISFIIALSFGTINIAFGDVVSSLLPFTHKESVLGNAQSHLVIEQIRLPRAILALLVGGMLGICGAATQGLFRNPLADPSLIGVTAGATVGSALMIFFSSQLLSLYSVSGIGLVSLGAFIGGALSVGLVYRLATNQNGTSVATMLLAGIAITAIAGSITSLTEFFADNEVLRRISLWRMGGLDGASTPRLWVGFISFVFVVGILPRYSTALNALLLGESEARHLGVAVQKVKVRIILLVAIGIASCVALAGSISFVGLIVPHIVRLTIGPDHRWLLPMSALGGAILLLLADTVARTVLAPIELPVGLVTALLGAPFFISLLRKRHDYGMR